MKKIIAALAALALTAQTAVTTVFADASAVSGTQIVSYSSTDTDADPTSYKLVPMEVVKAETYDVTLPKSLTFDGSEDSAVVNYDVTATGEISTVHYVRVIPMGDVTLTNEDETVAIDVDVAQLKKRWNYVEVAEGSGDNATTATVFVHELEPGTWTGYMKYFVSLDDGGIWTPATCTTPATCNGYDYNDNGVIDEDDDLGLDEQKEKLDEPITKGTALGHSFEDGAETFPGTCTRCNKLVYSISTPAQLVAFSNKVNAGNAYSGTTIELSADIDMSGIDFTPIGTSSTPFGGNFDGNGYTISNLKITQNLSNSGCVGMFGYISSTSGQTFKNFKLVNASVSIAKTASTGTAIYMGGLIGYIKPKAANLIYTFENIRITNLNMTASNSSTGTGSVDKLYISALIGYTVDYTVSSTGYKPIINVENDSIVGAIAVTSSLYDVYNTGVTYGHYLHSNISNSLIAVSLATAKDPSAHYATACALNGGNVAVYNTVYDKDICGNVSDSSKITSVSTLTGLSTSDCQSQQAVTILNTTSTHTWTVDLEGINEGYPYVKK